MKYHRYDETTKEYLHEFTAQRDQVTGGFLTPCNATKKAPPPTAMNRSKHIFKDGDWLEVEDHRDKTAYNKKTLEPRKVEELGTIPDHETLVEPADNCQKWENYGWIDDKEKKKTLTNKEAKKQRNHAIDSLKVEYQGHFYDADIKSLQLLEMVCICKTSVLWFDVDCNTVILSTADIREILQSAKSELAKIWAIR